MNKWIINNLSRFGLSHCLLCGSSAGAQALICQPCQQEFMTDQPSCRRCAIPLEEGQDNNICGACQIQPPGFQFTYSFAAYEPPLDRLIQQFKFHQKLMVGKELGKLMAGDISQQELSLPDILLPVPLHSSRLRQRGFNQALELAKPIAKRLGLQLDASSCIRKKLTSDQLGLSARKRKTNLKGAFEVKGSFTDKHLAVIDDVMTTGSTVNELSQQLIKAGARQVDVWVCARAVL